MEYLFSVFFFLFSVLSAHWYSRFKYHIVLEECELVMHMIDQASSSFSFSKTICLFLDMCYSRNIRDALSYIITKILKLCFEDSLKPVGINTVKPVMAMMSHVL